MSTKHFYYKARRRSSFLSFFLTAPFPLLSSCAACVNSSSFSPPAWAAVALSESSEFPVHCSVSGWKHHRCQHLVSFIEKKNKESDGIKMSVMANRTLSHSCNISVTDYQTGDSNSHSLPHTKCRPRKQKRMMSSKKREGTHSITGGRGEEV